MDHKVLRLVVLVGAVVSVPTAAAERSASVGDAIIVRRCPVEYRYATMLGAPASGILQDCLVQLGDKVKAGQLLGRLQNTEQQARVRVLEVQYNLAKKRAKTAERLRQSGAVSMDELDVRQAEEDSQRLALDEARAAVRTRELVSPQDGIVVGVFKNPGETINYERDVVFRVVNVQTLRVIGQVDVTEAWRVQVGQPVRISPEFAGSGLPIKDEVFTGRIVFVDSEIDPKTRTCRVIAEVNNRDNLLKSGLEVSMEIDPGLVAGEHPAAFGRPGAPDRARPSRAKEQNP